jgi:hypothetical protein
MAILTHGSDLRLAPTVRPLVAAGDGSVRSALERLARAGFDAVQLDATLAGLRPRDLSKTGRRDLAALMARQSMRIAGIDLFLPRSHYVEAQHLDRALSATLAGIELAADIGRVPVSIALPVKDVADEVKSAIVEAADGHGVRLAVHAEDQIAELLAWLNTVDVAAIGAGIDPAAIVSRGLSAAKVTAQFGKRLAVARLSDATLSAVRCLVGEGALDVATYRVTLDLASNRSGPVVLDLRGLELPMAAAKATRAAWEKAAFTV